MQRKNFYLSNIEVQLLEEESNRLDIAKSDLLRRIIDGYFQSNVYSCDYQNQIFVSVISN